MDYRALALVPLAALVLSVSAATPRVPEHWQVFAFASSSTPTPDPGYDVSLTPAGNATGTPTLAIRSTRAQLPSLPSVGALTQQAFGYAGKRLRFSAEVRAEGAAPWAGVYLAPTDGGIVVRLARGEHTEGNPLPAGSQVAADGRWQPVSVVMDMPAGSPQVSLGVALVGEGQLWARHLSFEVVGRDVPVTTTPIGIDWTMARNSLAETRRAMAQIPPQPLTNARLD
ncbi:MAG TPA: hypothetical protein VGE36_08580 [Roseateles sp.]